MAKISELADGGNLLATDELIVLRAGGNVRATFSGSVASEAAEVVSDSSPQLGGDLDTNGNDVTFGDNDKAIFGAGSDLQIYHDGTNSYIDDTSSGNLVLRGNPAVSIQKYTGEVSGVFNADGAVNLYYDNALKLATTSTGIDVTGTAVTDGVTVAGNILLQTEGNELQFNTSSTPVNKIYSDDTYTSNGLTISADNGVALKSTNNYLLLDDTGTNEMVLNVDGGERMRVTATGIDVTGSLTADALTVEDGAPVVNISSTTLADLATIQFTTSGSTVDSKITHQANTGVMTIDSGRNATWGGKIDFVTDTDTRMRINNNGDISFYNSAGTSQDLYWDASASRLGLGTTSPSNPLHASGTTSTPALFERTGSTGAYIGLKDSSGSLVYLGDNNGTFEVQTAGSSYATKLAVTSAGNVGIGTTSPSSLLDIDAGSSSEYFRGAGNSGSARYLVLSASTTTNAGDTHTFNASSSTGHLQFATAGVDRVTIDNSGNVGIGTTSPAAPLSIAGSSTGEYDALILRNGNSAASGQSTAIIFEASAGTSGDEAASVAKISGLRTGAGSKGDLLFHTTLAGVSSERMRIDSSGNVGVSTSSPANLMHLEGSQVAVGATQLTLEGRYNGYGAGVEFVSRTSSGGTRATMAKITADGEAAWNTTASTQDAGLRFSTTQDGTLSEKMRILASGNVGIGTQSPSGSGWDESAKVLHVYENTINGGLLALESSNTKAILNAGNNQLAIFTTTADPIRIGTSGSERMRIDSSGNVLVGTTDGTPYASNVKGAAIYNSGAVSGSVDGLPAAYFNRKTSDGTIVDFRKDGTTVGSIFSYNGFLGIGSTSGNDAYLLLGSDFVAPATSTGAARDGAIDLGSSSRRFKDLHLSGGTYLMGTGTSTDQTSTIQAAIDAAAPYSIIRLAGEFGYTSLTISTEGLTLIVDGVLKQFNSTGETSNGTIQISASHVTVQGGQFDGNGTANTILGVLSGADYCTVRDGLFKNVDVDNSMSASGGDFGAVLIAGDFGRVENCTFTDLTNTQDPPFRTNDSWPRGLTVTGDDCVSNDLSFFRVQCPHTITGARFQSINAYLEEIEDNGYYLLCENAVIMNPSIINCHDEPFVFGAPSNECRVIGGYVKNHGNAIAFDRATNITIDGLNVDSTACANLFKTRGTNTTYVSNDIEGCKNIRIRNLTAKVASLYGAINFETGTVRDFLLENSNIQFAYSTNQLSHRAKNITQAAQAEVETPSLHRFTAGMTVTIAGATPSSYNGTYTVQSVVSNKKFTINLNSSSLGAYSESSNYSATVTANDVPFGGGADATDLTDGYFIKGNDIRDFVIRGNTFSIADGNAPNVVTQYKISPASTVSGTMKVFSNNQIITESSTGDTRMNVEYAEFDSPFMFVQPSTGVIRDHESTRPIFWSSSAPSAGTYQDGTLILNSATTGGGRLGYARVGGTWKGFGRIGDEGTETADNFRSASTNTSYNLLARNGTGTALYVQQAGSGALMDLRTGSMTANQGTSQFLVDNSGNVGIGVTPARSLHVSDVMRLEPTSTPSSPSAGDIYFDSSTSKLRCYDGSAWNDLF